MKICVTAQGKDLAAEVDPRFGRAAYFILIDADTGEFEAHENAGTQQMRGAGTSAGKFLADNDVTTLITGNVGPNAFATLTAAGVEIYVGASGTVAEAVEAHKQGRLTKASSPTEIGGRFK